MATPISSGLFLLGGAASAAFAVLKHSSGRNRDDARPSDDMACPATPSTPYSRSAAGWLRGAGSSSPSKESRASAETGRSPTITAVSVPQEGISTRALEAGSLVCFYTSLGELVTVKKESKTWELHACLAPSPPDAEGSCRLPYFPAEAVFCVTRSGSKIGFRSLGADGRSLQAVKGANAPHRVANHNFGNWEAWEITSSGLVNVQWRHKVLGLEIREVRVVAREDIRKTERHQMHASRHSRSQVKSLERQLSDTERRLQEMVTASQRQTNISQHEVQRLQQQLSQAVSGRRSAEADAAQRAATMKQLEHRLGQLSSEKDSADDACEHAARRIQDLEGEIRDLRARHADQLSQLQQQQARGSSVAQGAGMSALQLRLAEAERRGAQARLDLEMAHSQAATDKVSTEAQMQSAVQAKDAEIQALLADRARLDAALTHIKGQISSAASPARPVLHHASPLLRTSVDAQTLRGLRKALEEADLNVGNANPLNRPQSTPPQLPKHPHKAQAAAPPAVPGSDAENHQPESCQASPLSSTSPDASGMPSRSASLPPAPHTAPPSQHSSMVLPPLPPVKTPSGLYAMLNPGATTQSGALYDLLKSADNSPRSSYATPRILSPHCTPVAAEARVSDTVLWKESMDSASDSRLRSAVPSSQASVDTTHNFGQGGNRQALYQSIDAASLARRDMMPSSQRDYSEQSAGPSWAVPQQTRGEQGREAADKTRLVQHFGPDAEDVEHMSERYIDEQLPGAVQVPRQEDPRPRFSEFALLGQPSCESLAQGEGKPGLTTVDIVLQGHEAFDDEITLAGSGRVTPSAEMAHQLPTDQEPDAAATSSEQHALTEQGHAAEQAGPSNAEGGADYAQEGLHAPSEGNEPNADFQGSPSPSEDPRIIADQLAADVQQVLAHAEKPLPSLPSLTPFRKTGSRAAALRSSWSHPLSPSNSQGSDETPGSKKRSSFLGRPLNELKDLW